MEPDARQTAPAMHPAVRETYGPANLGAEKIFAGGFEAAAR
ncbi:hypothetical protein [Streptomyces laurentii]